MTLASGSLTDASGAAGGGQVLVGGGWQGKDATIATAGIAALKANLLGMGR